MRYLVIDVGTSSLRALVMDEQATIVDSRVRSLRAPEFFAAESLWTVLCEMASDLEPARQGVSAVVVSSLLGWVGIDRRGEAVTPCYTYAHACLDAYRAIRWEEFAEEICFTAGRRPNPELGIFQLLHVKNTTPDIYRQITDLVSLKDYINLKLTGRAAMDRTSAAYTMAYDIRAGKWNSALLSLLGVDESKMPELLKPTDLLGAVSGTAAKSTGLREGTPVVVGSVDGSTGILGAGGLKPGTLVSVMGTTDTSFLVSDVPLRDKTNSLVLNPHVIPNRWLLGGPTGVYGGAVEWLQRTLLSESRSLDELTREAEKLPRGSEGVVVFPTLAGERAPFWQPRLMGTILGLEAKHTPAHLFRGILEANAYVLRYMLDLAQGAGGDISRVISIGGGSKNSLWLQIKAEVLGMPVIRTTVREATARGSCLLAQMALGEEARAGLDAERIFEGSREAAAEYAGLYRRYVKLHEQIAELYARDDE